MRNVPSPLLYKTLSSPPLKAPTVAPSVIPTTAKSTLPSPFRVCGHQVGSGAAQLDVGTGHAQTERRDAAEVFVAGKRKLDAAARLLATIGGKSQHTDAGDRSGGDSGRCRNQKFRGKLPPVSVAPRRSAACGSSEIL